MAEALPQSIAENNEDNAVADQENSISILLLASRWQFDTYGLSTVNKSLVNNLRVVDPEGKKIKITCTVLEEEINIENCQKEDAEKYKVKLRGAKQPRGPKKKPNIEWLDNSTAAYYLDLVRKDNYDFIIGHVPYLANGPLNFRDLCPDSEPKPKVILMIHDLPRSSDGETDEDVLLEWLSEADVVLSVGKEVKTEVFSSIVSLPSEHKPLHKSYIPGFPLELFKVSRAAVEGNKLQGTQNIMAMTTDKKDLDVNGLDFPLTVASAFGASKHMLECDSVKTNLVLLIENRADKDPWKKEFSELIQKESKGRSLHFQIDAPENLEKLKMHLRKSNLFICPLKSLSPIFGTEALSAVAAGVPILVSSHSGIASVLEIVSQDDSVVRESSTEPEAETWKDRILQKLLRPEDSQRRANRLKEALLLDTSIAQTHLDFTRIITERSSVRLEVELNSDSVVAQEDINRAITFGVHLGSKDTPIDAEKYVLVFIQKLLLQREKIDLGLLTDYLHSSITSSWQEVLSTLENSNRKLLGVLSGSLIFTLFCPTISSIQELQDDTWLKILTQRLEQLVKNIAGVESQLRIHAPEDVTLPKTKLLPRLPEMKQRHMPRSEGYGTTTQYSLDAEISERSNIHPPDVQETEMLPMLRDTKSEGYRSMTEVSSDITSEIFQGSGKVMEWLKRQRDLSADQEAADTSALNILERIKVNHINDSASSFYTKFSVSRSSDFIAIVSRFLKPSLTVLYPPLILSKENQYTSAIFIAISDQEYLAAASVDQIHLWNLAENTSSVVYKFKEEKDWHLCVIDERTVACVAERPWSDGFSKIYFLNTDREEFHLSSALRVEAGRGITDMCHVKTADGTPCLLLCSPFNSLIKCVEIVGVKVRWQHLDRQPWSTCTDGSTIFVADLGLNRLYLLSIENGSVLTSFDLRPFGFLPSCVRLHGEHLYVGHVNEKEETYCISKFTEQTTHLQMDA